MSIGDRLREERKRLAMDQVAFAQVGGVHSVAQSNYERGKRVPDANYLCAIADVGVDVQYVVTGMRAITEDQLADEARQMADAWEAMERWLLAFNRKLDIKKKRTAAEALYEASKSAQRPSEQLADVVMKLVAA